VIFAALSLAGLAWSLKHCRSGPRTPSGPASARR
jgi:hypothetical protein